jgi:polyhydroxyalkanoate synthesis regulator phasin
MQHIYKVLGRDQEPRSLLPTNLAFICFFSGLLGALLAIPSIGDAKSVAVSPGAVDFSIDFSVGQDPDPDSDQQPEVDDDDDDGDDDVDEVMKRRLQEASRRIEEAIDAGEITAEQGRERQEALRKRLAATRDRAVSRDGDGADEDVQRRLREAGRKIREGIAAGKITQKEGRARYEELRKRLTDRQEPAVEKPQQARPKKTRSIDGAAVRKRLEAAIESGAMTWEQARDRYIEVMEQDDKGRGELIRARLEKGIEAGKITEDQAVEIYIEMMEEGQQDSEEKEASDEKDSSQRTVTRQQYAEAQAKMEKMVEAGEITAEQMQQRLVEMRKTMGRQSEKTGTVTTPGQHQDITSHHQPSPVSSECWCLGTSTPTAPPARQLPCWDWGCWG